MSFYIEFKNNQEELNKIRKNPATVFTANGTLRDGSSIVDPEILVEYEGTLSNVNYMYIPEFHRYYFINDIESVRTNLWLVHAHCDVLKSFSNGILNCTGVIARQENEWNLYLNDSAFKSYCNPRLEICNFPNAFTGESYILALKGAQTTAPSS